MSGIYDQVQNPIPRNNFFTTPSLGQIQDMIEALPKNQRANAHLIMTYTLNACYQLVEDRILSKEVFA
jgi:hypothetical protein